MRIGIRDRRVFIRPRIPRDRPVATLVDIEQDEQGLVVEMRLTPHGRRVLAPMFDDQLKHLSLGPTHHHVSPFEMPPLEDLEKGLFMRGRIPNR